MPDQRWRRKPKTLVFETWDQLVIWSLENYPTLFLPRHLNRKYLTGRAETWIRRMTDGEWEDACWLVWDHVFCTGGNGHAWDEAGNNTVQCWNANKKGRPPAVSRRVGRAFPTWTRPRWMYPVFDSCGQLVDVSSGQTTWNVSFTETFVKGFVGVLNFRHGRQGPGILQQGTTGEVPSWKPARRGKNPHKNFEILWKVLARVAPEVWRSCVHHRAVLKIHDSNQDDWLQKTNKKQAEWKKKINKEAKRRFSSWTEDFAEAVQRHDFAASEKLLNSFLKVCEEVEREFDLLDPSPRNLMSRTPLATPVGDVVGSGN